MVSVIQNLLWRKACYRTRALVYYWFNFCWRLCLTSRDHSKRNKNQFKRAVAGECEKNYKYMVSACGPACMSCDQLLLENRCPIDKSAEPAWKPGSLNAMFEYLISEEVTSKYPATILSRDPWVVTLDDVISEEEALRLIELGGLEGYKRSEDVGEKKADGSYGSVVSTGRTSSNAWCVGDCYTDPVARNVMDRLSNLTMINETNSEFLQLLRWVRHDVQALITSR